MTSNESGSFGSRSMALSAFCQVFLQNVKTDYL